MSANMTGAVGPGWGRLTLGSGAALAVVCALVLPASAQSRRKRPRAEPAASAPKEPKAKAPKGDAAPASDATSSAPDDAKAPKKDGKPGVKNFDFSGLDLAGRMRTPQLLYFLERANEELERASLEKRSFIPQLVRTVEDETL